MQKLASTQADDAVKIRRAQAEEKEQLLRELQRAREGLSRVQRELQKMTPVVQQQRSMLAAILGELPPHTRDSLWRQAQARTQARTQTRS